MASSNLRQIGQASLIYAADHGDKLPVADNIWDFAGELARGGGLNDATIWTVIDDPANRDAVAGLSTVLTKDRNGLEPTFRRLVPSWAVALGQLDASMPSTMPIAWTRGLRPDGTWSPDSPYGIDGGYIVFLGGNVSFFRDVKGAFQRFDGKGTTSSVRDALPSGTRIGEYVPSEREKAEWAWDRRVMQLQKAAEALALPALWLLTLITLVVQVARKRWPSWLLVWFLVLSFLAAIVTA